MTTATIQIHGPGLCACPPPCHWQDHGILHARDNGTLYYDREDNGIWWCNRAIVATVGRRLVGIMRYSIQRSVLQANGTFVWGDARRRGLGFHLWETAFAFDRPRRVRVTCISRNSKRLLARLQECYPQIAWSIDYNM